jgi:hypothetical protein
VVAVRDFAALGDDAGKAKAAMVVVAVDTRSGRLREE